MACRRYSLKQQKTGRELNVHNRGRVKSPMVIATVEYYVATKKNAANLYVLTWKDF